MSKIKTGSLSYSSSQKTIIERNTRLKRSTSTQNLTKTSTKIQTNYRMTHYTRIEQTPEEENGPKIVMEVEGIPLSSRGKSKGILYVECASHRRRNDPECNFRGRIINYHSSDGKGMI